MKKIKFYSLLQKKFYILFIILGIIIVPFFKCSKKEVEPAVDSGQVITSSDSQSIINLHSGILEGKKNVSEIILTTNNFGSVLPNNEAGDYYRSNSTSVYGTFFGKDGKYLKTDFIIHSDTIEKSVAVHDESVFGPYYTYAYPDKKGPIGSLENNVLSNNMDIVISNTQLGSYHFTHKAIKEVYVLNNISQTISKKQPLEIRWMELAKKTITIENLRNNISSYDTIAPTLVEGEKVLVGIGVDPAHNDPTITNYNANDCSIYKEVENNGIAVFSPEELNKLDTNTEATAIVVIKGKESSFPATEQDDINISELSMSTLDGYSIVE